MNKENEINELRKKKLVNKNDSQRISKGECSLINKESDMDELRKKKLIREIEYLELRKKVMEANFIYDDTYLLDFLLTCLDWKFIRCLNTRFRRLLTFSSLLSSSSLKTIKSSLS